MQMSVPKVDTETRLPVNYAYCYSLCNISYWTFGREYNFFSIFNL